MLIATLGLSCGAGTALQLWCVGVVSTACGIVVAGADVVSTACGIVVAGVDVVSTACGIVVAGAGVVSTGMWDRGRGGRASAPFTARWILNHRMTREVLLGSSSS